MSRARSAASRVATRTFPRCKSRTNRRRLWWAAVKKLALAVLGVVCVLAVPASAAKLPILASQDWWPVFSPDGGSIAFTRVDGQGRVFTLDVVPARGGRVVRLAQAGSQLLPSWSPDSSHLAYQAGGRIYTVARN